MIHTQKMRSGGFGFLIAGCLAIFSPPAAVALTLGFDAGATAAEREAFINQNFSIFGAASISYTDRDLQFRSTGASGIYFYDDTLTSRDWTSELVMEVVAASIHEPTGLRSLFYGVRGDSDVLNLNDVHITPYVGTDQVSFARAGDARAQPKLVTEPGEPGVAFDGTQTHTYITSFSAADQTFTLAIDGITVFDRIKLSALFSGPASANPFFLLIGNPCTEGIGNANILSFSFSNEPGGNGDPIPEPGTLLLLGIAGLGLASRRSAQTASGWQEGDMLTSSGCGALKN